MVKYYAIDPNWIETTRSNDDTREWLSVSRRVWQDGSVSISLTRICEWHDGTISSDPEAGLCIGPEFLDVIIDALRRVK